MVIYWFGIDWSKYLVYKVGSLLWEHSVLLLAIFPSDDWYIARVCKFIEDYKKITDVFFVMVICYTGRTLNITLVSNKFNKSLLVRNKRFLSGLRLGSTT